MDLSKQSCNSLTLQAGRREDRGFFGVPEMALIVANQVGKRTDRARSFASCECWIGSHDFSICWSNRMGTFLVYGL